MKILFLSDNYMEDPVKTDPFRLELMLELAKRTEEFKYIQCTDYMNWEGVFKSPKQGDDFLTQVKNFNPDIVISLNASGLNEQTRAELKSANIKTWFIDNPSRFPNLLKQYHSNEIVYCATRYMMHQVKKESPEINNHQVKYLPFCCNPKEFEPKHPAPLKKCDVSFVGTLWNPDGMNSIVRALENKIGDSSILADLLYKYEENYDYPIGKILKSNFDLDFSERQIKNFFDDYISTQSRLRILAELSSFDLRVYGTRTTWPAMALLYNPKLFRKLRSETIMSSERLANLYHCSRVCLSIAHHQAQSGFPIRIFDIMCSGSPLLTDCHSELSELFEENKMFLVFNDAASAKEKTKFLIENSQFSQIMSQNALVEVKSNHTFENRVDSILGGATLPKKMKIYISSTKFQANNFISLGGDVVVERVTHLSVKQSSLNFFIFKHALGGFVRSSIFIFQLLKLDRAASFMAHVVNKIKAAINIAKEY